MKMAVAVAIKRAVEAIKQLENEVAFKNIAFTVEKDYEIAMAA